MQATERFSCLLFVLAIVSQGGRATAQSILASDDTWVREDNPTSNRNGDLLMNVRTNSSSDDNDVILLRFDTTSLTEPVSGAALQLTWFRSDPAEYSLVLYGLNETHPAETTWDEATVVYDDAPGLIPDAMDPAAEAALGNTDEEIQDLDTDNVTLLVGPVPYGPQVEGNTYTFSGAGLDDFVNADTNGQVTFLILRGVATSANQARFMTKENTSSDTGVVTGPEGFAGPRLYPSEPPAPPTQEIPASDDTWVREDNPTSNRNGDLQLNARTDSDADDNDVILLRFDTTSITTDVTGAKLQLTWFRSNDTSSRSLYLYGLNETHAAETTWDEATVVYDDAPGLIPDGLDPAGEFGLGRTDDDIQDLDTANLTLLLGPVPYGPQVEGEDYAFSGDGLDAFINADTNGQVTFLILRDLDTSSNQARFMTKENTSSDTGVVTGAEGFAAPRLVLLAPPPEGILASDDTWVREDNPTSNRNDNLQMNARTDSDGDDNDVILLRFDTSSITGVVSGAEIRLTWFRSDGTSSRSLFLYGLNETHAAETTWDESAVVYNDAPGLIPDGVDPAAEAGLGNTDDDIQDLDTANLTLLLGPVSYGPQVEGEQYAFSGEGLDDFINADTNGQVTFLILRDIDTSGNQARFMTKENTSSDTGAVTGPEGFAGPRLIAPEEPPPPLPGILASDDTWVREDNPTSNRDENLQMNARTDSDGDDNDVILLRFDTTSIEEPVSGAQLQLTWFRSDGTSSRSLFLYGLNETHFAETFWQEELVTYDDAPGLIPDGLDPTAEVALGNTDDEIQDLDTGNLTLLIGPVPYGPQVEGEPYVFSDAALDDFINADTNGQVTFLILRDIATSGNQARFMTKENTSSDTGVITGPEGFAGPRLFTEFEAPRFVRGDADSDNSINLTDGIVILDFLFRGGPEPACLDAADADDDGGELPVITDAIRIFGWLFTGGPAPAPPTPTAAAYTTDDCGIDTTDDLMDCAETSGTCQ